MAGDDGFPLGPPFKILDNGPDDRRFNIVIAGDGYQSGDGQIPFQKYCRDFLDYLRARPWWPALGRTINVHRFDIVSTDGEPDIPAGCPGGPVSARTYFDSRIECEPASPSVGWVTIDFDWAAQVFDQAFPGYGCAAIVTNTSQGGGFARGDVVSVGAGDTDPFGTLLHEIGHVLAPLDDNYIRQGTTAPAGGEPYQRNLTAQTDLSKVKWRHWFPVQPGDPPPVMRNPNCSQADPRSNPFGAGDRVGLFESSYYFCGWFRPTFDCRMRRSNLEFCPVCLEAIHESLSQYATPVFRVRLESIGGTGVDFGAVAVGQTSLGSFLIRNTSFEGRWPPALNVTLSPEGSGFSLPTGTESSFKIPAPLLEPEYARVVEVAFTAPAPAGESFTGRVVVTAPGMRPLGMPLRARSV